jgi:hypothetical protein
VATEVPPNFMTIQGALSGNGAFTISLTGFFAVKNPRSVALQREKGNVGSPSLGDAALCGSRLCRRWTFPLSRSVGFSPLKRLPHCLFSPLERLSHGMIHFF